MSNLDECVTKNVSGLVRVSEWAHLWLRGPVWDRGETEDDFMTLRGQDQGQEQRGAGGGGGGMGRGAAQAVSSEGLLEGSAGARLGPQDPLSPRRGPGMHQHTMSSWGLEGTPI